MAAAFEMALARSSTGTAPTPFERFCGLVGESLRLRGPALARQPFGPVELRPRRPVRVAELSKQRLRASQVRLHLLLAPFDRGEQRPSPCALGTKERRYLARRTRRDELDQVRERLGIGEGDGGVEGVGKGDPDAFVGEFLPTTDDLVDGAAGGPEGETRIALCESDEALGRQVHDPRLDIVAVGQRAELLEVLARLGGVASDRLDPGQPAVELLASEALWAAGQQQVTPQPVRLVEATGQDQDIDEVAGRHRLSLAAAGASGGFEPSLAVLLGTGEIPCHAQVGQVALGIGFHRPEPVAA